jgi:peptidoglycan/LPS O-acetylase OafA/YrhL
MRKGKINLNLISRYRGQLFGIAILSIMCFHYSIDISNWLGNDNWFENLIYNYVEYIGSIGVEMFVFLSGMGLYYSFSKDSNLKNFYKKRLKRIILPYLIVAVIFWGLKDLYLLHLGVVRFIKDLLFITFFTEKVHTLWYILLMLVVYILFPIFYKLLDNQKFRVFNLVWLLAIFVGLAIVLFQYNTQFYYNVQLALTRIPVFILGCFMGKWIKEEKEISVVLAVVVTVLGIALKLYLKTIDCPNWLGRYADIIYMFALLAIFILILDCLRQFTWILQMLSAIGKYSLELYLVHVSVRNLQHTLGLQMHMLNVMWLIIVVGVCTMAVGLNRLCGMIEDKLHVWCE